MFVCPAAVRVLPVGGAMSLPVAAVAPVTEAPSSPPTPPVVSPPGSPVLQHPPSPYARDIPPSPYANFTPSPYAAMGPPSSSYPPTSEPELDPQTGDAQTASPPRANAQVAASRPSLITRCLPNFAFKGNFAT